MNAFDFECRSNKKQIMQWKQRKRQHEKTEYILKLSENEIKK